MADSGRQQRHTGREKGRKVAPSDRVVMTGRAHSTHALRGLTPSNTDELPIPRQARTPTHLAFEPWNGPSYEANSCEARTQHVLWLLRFGVQHDRSCLYQVTSHVLARLLVRQRQSNKVGAFATAAAARTAVGALGVGASAVHRRAAADAPVAAPATACSPARPRSFFRGGGAP